jgi:hypothetical protein
MTISGILFWIWISGTGVGTGFMIWNVILFPDEESIFYIPWLWWEKVILISLLFPLVASLWPIGAAMETFEGLERTNFWRRIRYGAIC